MRLYDAIATVGPPHGIECVLTATDELGNVDSADDWRAALAETGRLSPQIVQAIVDAHGNRGVAAIEAVSERRVKRYHDFDVVVGYDDEHVVEDRDCARKDFQYNLDPDEGERCWHVLAVDIAEAFDGLDHHDMWYSDVREFL